jgi:hypothetical protein
LKVDRDWGNGNGRMADDRLIVPTFSIVSE